MRPPFLLFWEVGVHDEVSKGRANGDRRANVTRRLSKEEAALRRLAYTQHCELFRHYSSRIFAARTAFVTASVTIAGYVWGFSPLGMLASGDADPDPDHRVASMLSILTAVFLAVLGTMENLYFTKYNQVIIAIRNLEDGGSLRSSFFRNYEPFAHRFLYVYYFLVILAYSLFSIVSSPYGWTVCVLFALVPLLFVFSAFAQMSSTATNWREELKRTGQERNWAVRYLTSVDLHDRRGQRLAYRIRRRAYGVPVLKLWKACQREYPRARRSAVRLLPLRLFDGLKEVRGDQRE